jgi:hypothetical protein
MSFSAGNSGSPSYFPDGYNGSQLANIETISATRILTSSDRRIQILTPNGATRIVQLPGSTVLGEEWVFINPSTSSQSLTITSSNTATIVTIVPGSTIRVNALVASPSAPSDWVLNSLGNTVGPASAVDNAIVRFDGTTGKLVQNSGVAVDDNNNVRMLGTSGNPVYCRFDQVTANSGKLWRAGHTGAVAGFSSFDIYNETDNIVALSAASSGNVTLGPSSFSGVHNINGVVRVVVPGATTGGFRLSGTTSESHLQFLGTNASTNGSLRFYSYRSDLSNELDVGSISGSGAWRLGPNAGAGHTVYGTLSLGPTSSNTGPTPSGLTTFNDSSLSVHWRMFRLSATTIDHYISGTEYHIINASGGVKLTVGATSWAAISDERKKKNISSLEYGLNEVMQINPIRFDYNSDDSESGKRIGFSAQNLRPIIPESVSEDVEMDVLSASSTELIPVLVKAIQELKAELDVAKARIEALENP